MIHYNMQRLYINHSLGVFRSEIIPAVIFSSPVFDRGLACLPEKHGSRSLLYTSCIRHAL